MKNQIFVVDDDDMFDCGRKKIRKMKGFKNGKKKFTWKDERRRKNKKLKGE